MAKEDFRVNFLGVPTSFREDPTHFLRRANADNFLFLRIETPALQTTRIQARSRRPGDFRGPMVDNSGHRREWVNSHPKDFSILQQDRSCLLQMQHFIGLKDHLLRLRLVHLIRLNRRLLPPMAALCPRPLCLLAPRRFLNSSGLCWAYFRSNAPGDEIPLRHA